jgi:hypothetical protein
VLADAVPGSARKRHVAAGGQERFLPPRRVKFVHAVTRASVYLLYLSQSKSFFLFCYVKVWNLMDGRGVTLRTQR